MQEAKASKLVSIEQDLIVGIDQKLDKIINILERIALLSSWVKSASN